MVVMRWAPVLRRDRDRRHGRLRPPSAPRRGRAQEAGRVGLGWAPPGGDTGSSGSRRRPGKADMAMPTTMISPPTQSHSIRGWTTTRRPMDGFDVVAARCRDRYTSRVRPMSTDGVPMFWPVAVYWLIRG